MIRSAQQLKTGEEIGNQQEAYEQERTHAAEAAAKKGQNYEEAQRQLQELCVTLQQDVSRMDAEIACLGKNLGKKLNWIYDYEASTLLPALQEDHGRLTEETKTQLDEICSGLKQSLCQLDVDISRMNRNICEKMKWIFEYESDTLLPTLQAGRDQITKEISEQLAESRAAMQEDFSKNSAELNKTVQELAGKYDTVLHAVESMRDQQNRRSRKLQWVMGLCGLNTIAVAAALVMMLLH